MSDTKHILDDLEYMSLMLDHIEAKLTPAINDLIIKASELEQEVFETANDTCMSDELKTYQTSHLLHKATNAAYTGMLVVCAVVMFV